MAEGRGYVGSRRRVRSGGRKGARRSRSRRSRNGKGTRRRRNRNVTSSSQKSSRAASSSLSGSPSARGGSSNSSHRGGDGRRRGARPHRQHRRGSGRGSRRGGAKNHRSGGSGRRSRERSRRRKKGRSRGRKGHTSRSSRRSARQRRRKLHDDAGKSASRGSGGDSHTRSSSHIASRRKRASGGLRQGCGREARNALTYGREVNVAAGTSEGGGSTASVDAPLGYRARPLCGAGRADCSECTGDGDSRSATAESSSSYYSSGSSLAAKGAAGATKEGAAGGSKDEIAHFVWEPGMLLNNNYLVTKLLGDGTFGRVLLAKDKQRADTHVAVKVIRDVEKYKRNAKREAEILGDIRDADPNENSGCVHVHETFTHDGRFFCIVCEVLGISLYDLLKRNKFQGLWVQDIQSIARQCLDALGFLHGNLSLAHTDLKLENILFESPEQPRTATFPRAGENSSRSATTAPYVRPACTKIKLIDFGNATYELEHHSSIINTRQYRAPEVILSLGWDERADLWSMGCILMELYSGELLFRTHESLEHLALMENVVERFPVRMFNEAGAAKKDLYLTEEAGTGNWRLHWPENASTQKSQHHVMSQRPLLQLVLKQHRLLADFVAMLLRPEPGERPSAAQALKHAFLSESFPD